MKFVGKVHTDKNLVELSDQEVAHILGYDGIYDSHFANTLEKMIRNQ